MRTVMVAGFAFMLCVCAALAQELPVRLIAEAEDFKVAQGEWQVMPYRGNYYASTFALTFLSRMACLSAPPQVETEAVAIQEINVPGRGRYRVFARYEQPYDFSVGFTIQVEQGGNIVYNETSCRRTWTRSCGSLWWTTFCRPDSGGPSLAVRSLSK
jgi:hypothetical protein